MFFCIVFFDLFLQFFRQLVIKTQIFLNNDVKKSNNIFTGVRIFNNMLFTNFVNSIIYITMPNNIPIKRYALNSPSLNLNIAVIIKNPDISQNKISSIYVIKLFVLNFILRKNLQKIYTK